MNDRSSFRPERIRIAREAKGLTLEELGERLGFSKATLSRYESGIVKGIRKNTLNEISLALDVDPKWLMGTSEEMHLSPGEREVLESFGDMETAVLQPRQLNPMEELGMCLALVATDSSVREFVKELMALPSEQRAIALKMLKALR